MSAKFKYTGKIVSVDPIVAVGSKGFRKRTFVVSSDPNAQYPDCIAFDLKGGKTDHTGEVSEADEGREAEVTFYVESRKWEDPKGGGHRWFTTAVATGIEFIDEKKIAVPVVEGVTNTEDTPEDLPF